MIYFISDLHLSINTPGTFHLFNKFLNTLTDHDSLYILGDFFEAWPGDDCLDDPDNPFNLEVVRLLDQKTSSGLSIHVMHGNRDFLLNGDFCRRSGVSLISDPFELILPETTFLLSHGDALCTQDKPYQQLRSLTRSAAWQKALLAKPLAERYAMAKALREQSEAAVQTRRGSVEEYLMDLDPQAIDDLLRRFLCRAFIHGHTHRPDHHYHHLGDTTIERWVLSDWCEDYGQALVWDGARLYSIDLN